MLEVNEIAKICQKFMNGKLPHDRAMWLIHDIMTTFVLKQMERTH